MRVSIVTPSFNQAKFLALTAQNVLSQSGDFDLKWIVIDGGSNDGTIELLRSLNDPRLTWVSEKDRGQAHALNKGLQVADGEVIGWLNSDDLYLPDTLQTVVDALHSDARAQWIVGSYQIIDESGKQIRPSIARYKERALKNYRFRSLLRENFISQPAVFWRSDFGRQIGAADESLHWTMDYDLWLRMGRKCDPLIIPRPLAQFRIHGSSKSGKVDRRQFDEQYQVAGRYFDGDWVSRIVHRMNVEKIVWSYRVMRMMGM